jgi:hypothetical protein
MSWKNQLRGDSLPWLLESDNPGVRYLALRDLLDLPSDDPKLKSARKSAHKEGPIAVKTSEVSKTSEVYSSKGGAHVLEESIAKRLSAVVARVREFWRSLSCLVRPA